MDDEADGPERQAEQPGKARRRGQRHPPNAQGVCKAAPGMAKPQMPAAATTMRAAGEMSRASTAAEPTTRPPMMERLCPTDCGSETLASLQQLKGGQQPEHIHDGWERHRALAL